MDYVEKKGRILQLLPLDLARLGYKLQKMSKKELSEYNKLQNKSKENKKR